MGGLRWWTGHVDGDGAVTLRLVGQESVAGIDGQARDSTPVGIVPGSPILQVGGVQEAVRVAPPRLARAVALLVPVVLVVVLKSEQPRDWWCSR